ncbi:MAG: hypothetical protein POELPBGB_03232 [Bacteroidia bacterium]|nr:hypothetical protein [Bacteroidia bacterium]
MIPTNPGFNYPINEYDSVRANTRGWLPTLSEVNKATVLKARAFKNGNIPSYATTATYFIDMAGSNRYSLPVISVSMDSVSLFSNETGMYVYGYDTVLGGNYNREDVEKLAHIEWFDEDGNLFFSQYCGAKNHGGGGRSAPQKTLRFVARDEYGDNRFGYQVFTDKNTNEFKHLILRNSGHRPDCFPRDNLAAELVKNLGFEVRHSRNVISFINGEYWGIQTIKEHFDDHYFGIKYNTERDSIVVLAYAGSVQQGTIEDEQHYTNLLQFVANNNMSNENNFSYVKTQMDVENYLNYVASEIYYGNGDWPVSNIKYWRYRRAAYEPEAGVNLDGRWRWIMYDLDGGFGGDCTGIYYAYNSVVPAFADSSGDYTILLRSFIQNPVFKRDFINRIADLMNTNFLPSRVSSYINSTYDEVTPEMMEHVERWRYPSTAVTLADRANETPSLDKWNAINSDLHLFAGRRPSKLRQYMMQYFAIPDTFLITVNVSDSGAGRVKISSLLIDENTTGITGSAYPWTGMYFESVPVPLKAIPRPGYRFVQWLNTGITNPDTVVFLNSDTSFTAVFEIDSAFQPYHHVFINELCASNSSFNADEYGEYDDWFEIYNPNNFPVDLDGYYITDSLENKTKYKFASGQQKTIIPANSYALVWCDEQGAEGVLHANFKLSAEGEELALILPDGVTVVDSIIFGVQQINHSWGRETDGNETWIDFEIPTPDTANIILTSIPEIENETGFSVYPNPGNNSNIVYFSKPVDVLVYNSIGQLLFTTNKISASLDVSALKPGVYFFKTSKSELLKWVKL